MKKIKIYRSTDCVCIQTVRDRHKGRRHLSATRYFLSHFFQLEEEVRRCWSLRAKEAPAA
jgi:hypothetical protein